MKWLFSQLISQNSVNKYTTNMKFIIFTTLLLSMIGFQELLAQQGLFTKADTVGYSLGVLLASNLKQQGLEKLDLNLVMLGLKDEMRKAATLDVNTAGQIVNTYILQEKEGQKMVNLEQGKKFLEENKKQEGVVVLPSGLQYKVLQAGTGAIPQKTDQVKVHYHGTLTDGTVFDSSIQRGEPATFGVTQVIQGWVEALQLMPAGSKWRLFLPAELAYGERGAGAIIKPNSSLIFDVELIEIVK